MQTAQFEIGIEDYAAFANRLNAAAIKERLNQSLLGPGFAIILAGITPAWALLSITLFLSDRPLGGAALAAICAYTVFFWIRWRRRCSVSALTQQVHDITMRQFESGQFRIPLGRQSVTLGVDGIEYAREGVESRYAWRAVDHVEIAPEHLYIFDRSNGAIIVPTRSFASASEQDEFEMELETRLAESRDRHPPAIRGATRKVVRDASVATTRPVHP